MYFNEVEFGNRIRNLRKSRGITQERLAEELNISYESVRKIENGTRSASYDVLLDFCPRIVKRAKKLSIRRILRPAEHEKPRKLNISEVCV